MKNILFLSLILTLMTACPILPDNHVNEGCNASYYNFDMPVSFTPPDSIISLGDTITITSTIPREKKDNRFNLIFLLDSVDFHMGGGIIRLDTLMERGKRYRFIDDFEWVADSIYNFKKGNNAYGFDYYYDDEKYYIQFKMIPKKKGIYNFELNSLIGATPNIKGKIIKTIDGECRTDAWDVHFMTNEGNNYKELLKLSPNEGYNTKVYNKWSKYNTIRGAHNFKVE